MKSLLLAAFRLMVAGVVASLPINSFAQVDMGALDLFAPVQKSCYGNAEVVTVRIKNFSTAVHNFATAPVTVNASVTGPNATTFTPVVVNTGTLNAGDVLNVVISSTYSMTAGGNYTFNANTTVTGDINTANNAMTATAISAPGLVAGTIVATPSTYCGTGGTPALMLNGGSGGNIQWQESANANGPWTNVGTNSVNYTPSSAITANRYYRAYRSCSGTGDTSAVMTVTVSGAQLNSSTPANRCGPGTVTLTGSASAGATVQWTTAQQGGSIAGSGNSFTTPSLTASTTYYASAWTAGASYDAGIKISDFALCGFPTTNNTVDLPLRFTTNKGVILNSVYIIPSATSVTLALRPQLSATNIATQTFTFTAAQLGNPQKVNLNWSVAVPGNYQITNAAGGLWTTVNLGCGFPFTAPGGSLVITSSGYSSTLSSSTTFYNGFYQINFTEGCQSTPVAVAATVNDVTVITQQPQASISTCAGANLNLVVAASGVNLVYQWRKNGVNITNTNNDTLFINGATLNDAGVYDVVITGLCGNAVTSTTATVNIASGNAWLGKVSSNWNDAGNWCAGIPDATSNVTIFGGTPFQPTITTGSIDVRSLAISTGATVTAASNTTINIYGDFTNNGTFNAPSANVIFKGALNQLVSNVTAGNVTVNGSGITLTGAMTVNQALVLTNGNVTLGNNNLTVTGSVAGNSSNHIITNGTGSVITNNVTANAVTVPVGTSATNYNPVIISNGGGKNYSVRVATGLTPSIANAAHAVNRTWTIIPNAAPSAPVTITVQYEDGHMNAQGVATNNMEVGVHNGTSWAIVGTGILPAGGASSRQVAFTTSQFGPIAVSNIGGISWITATTPQVDRTVSSIKLYPNPVENTTIVKVMSTRSVKMQFEIIDVQGKVVKRFDKNILQGANDILLQLNELPAGLYSMKGVTDKGVATIRFVKQ